MPAVRRHLLLLVCLAAAAGSAGCFYTDPINSRPTVEVKPGTGVTVYRNQTLTVWADVDEPDGDGYSVGWTAVACGPGGVPCKLVPVSGVPESDSASIPVPVEVEVEGEGVPVASISVTATVTDSYGATVTGARTFEVGNQPPTITLSAEGYRYQNSFPIDLPLAIVAVWEDTDLDHVALDAEWPPPVAPPGAEGLFDWVRDDSRENTYLFTPHAAGGWNFTVSGRDPFVEAPVSGYISLTTAADVPPCIAGQQPPIEPDQAFPLFEQHRFTIVAVTDDLDIYPLPDTLPSPFHGTARFRWSLASPDTGGLFVPLPDTDNDVELRPGLFDPGDQVQLRAEVYDRKDRSIDCPVGQPTCAIGADQSCLQRQTWEIVVH